MEIVARASTKCGEKGKTRRGKEVELPQLPLLPQLPQLPDLTA